MMKQAVIVSTLETAIIVMLSVSVMNAIETAARKTPKYRLALLLKNSVNSVRIVFEYLLKRVSIDAKVRKMITNV